MSQGKRGLAFVKVKRTLRPLRSMGCSVITCYDSIFIVCLALREYHPSVWKPLSLSQPYCVRMMSVSLANQFPCPQSAIIDPAPSNSKLHMSSSHMLGPTGCLKTTHSRIPSSASMLSTELCCINDTITEQVGLDDFFFFF